MNVNEQGLLKVNYECCLQSHDPRRASHGDGTSTGLGSVLTAPFSAAESLSLRRDSTLLLTQLLLPILCQSYPWLSMALLRTSSSSNTHQFQHIPIENCATLDTKKNEKKNSLADFAKECIIEEVALYFVIQLVTRDGKRLIPWITCHSLFQGCINPKLNGAYGCHACCIYNHSSVQNPWVPHYGLLILQPPNCAICVEIVLKFRCSLITDSMSCYQSCKIRENEKSISHS